MDHARTNSLAAAYRHGDESALQPLVEGLARPLLAQAYGLLHDWDQAADVVQDTWLRVLRSIATYDPCHPFLPWIRTILRHLCWQQLAREARSPALMPLSGAPDPATNRPADDPEHEVRAADLRRRLARNLSDLADSQRQALIMVDLEQRDRAEVAQQLNLTPASLRVVLCRARRALAERLHAEETP